MSEVDVGCWMLKMEVGVGWKFKLEAVSWKLILEVEVGSWNLKLEFDVGC